MPVLSHNTNNLTFTLANQQWIIEPGVFVAPPGDSLGAVVIPSAGDQLINNGNVVVNAGFISNGAVFVGPAADGTIVANGSTGSIVGPIGVNIIASNAHVSNAGSIVGFAGFAVQFSPVAGGTAELGNAGYIHGKTAAIIGTLVDGLTFTNSGMIDSDGDAIKLLVRGKAVIDNSGIISGDDSAIIA